MSAGYGSPDASHILGYMLMVVNPGMVFTSLTNISPVSRGEQEVDARHAGAVDRPERRRSASRWIVAACAALSGAGMSVFDASSRYFAS